MPSEFFPRSLSGGRPLKKKGKKIWPRAKNGLHCNLDAGIVGGVKAVLGKIPYAQEIVLEISLA